MEPAGGRELDVDALGDVAEGTGRFAVRCDGDDRRTHVASLAQRGHERHLTEQGNLESLGEMRATTAAEQLVPSAVVAGEPGHVLDDALHLEVDLVRHEAGPLRDTLGRGLRGG